MTSEVFEYRGHHLTAGGVLTCHYALGGRAFTERVELGPGRWTTPAAREAARLAYLVTGVSYYKTAAPPVIRLDLPVRPAELTLLHDLYTRGLAEFAYRNGLDLSEIRFEVDVVERAPVPFAPASGRPLILFGGGKDSIVTVEALKSRRPGAALFVVSPPEAPFEAIEQVVPITGLPVVRAIRRLDPQLLEPAGRTGFLQGHVPVTGILAALAILAAVGRDHEAVVLSNERSASDPNLILDGEVVNHQYSKSEAFEVALAGAVAAAVGPELHVFSFLRPYSELWVAERFAHLRPYHRAFRSCNRAFALDPARRLRRWCATCDKCCFVDLILAPFLERRELEVIFDGREPLGRPELLGRFETLLGLSSEPKPFECVGEVGESRVAVLLAAQRPDRADNPLLAQLAARLAPVTSDALQDLFSPHRLHHVPDELAPEDLLV
jgi:hypothetical protein